MDCPDKSISTYLNLKLMITNYIIQAFYITLLQLCPYLVYKFVLREKFASGIFQCTFSKGKQFASSESILVEGSIELKVNFNFKTCIKRV